MVASKKENNFFLSKEKHGMLIRQINTLKQGNRRKVPKVYQRYDVVQFGQVKRLIFPVAEGNTSLNYYVQIEELFNVIHEIHVSIGHGGRNRMVKEIGLKYKNIIAECIMVYLNLWVPCLKKSKVTKKGLVVKPKIFSDMNSIVKQMERTNGFWYIKIILQNLCCFDQLHLSVHMQLLTNCWAYIL